MAERDDRPEARAHALITRILGLVQECRAILPELEPPAAERRARWPNVTSTDR